MNYPYGPPGFGQRGIRTERYSLRVIRESVENSFHFSLWDRRNDPFMQHDIAPTRRDLVNELCEAHLIPELARIDDPFDTDALRTHLGR